MRSGLLPNARLLHRALSKSSFNAPTLLQRRLGLVSLRHFSHPSHLRQDGRQRQNETQARIQLRPEQSENIKPESYEEPTKAKPNEPLKTDGLLSEQTVSNKEQRKADWAIMKEMSRYLWPKVLLAHVYGLGGSLMVDTG